MRRRISLFLLIGGGSLMLSPLFFSRDVRSDTVTAVEYALLPVLFVTLTAVLVRWYRSRMRSPRDLLADLRFPAAILSFGLLGPCWVDRAPGAVDFFHLWHLRPRGLLGWPLVLGIAGLLTFAPYALVAMRRQRPEPTRLAWMCFLVSAYLLAYALVLSAWDLDFGVLRSAFETPTKRYPPIPAGGLPLIDQLALASGAICRAVGAIMMVFVLALELHRFRARARAVDVDRQSSTDRPNSGG